VTYLDWTMFFKAKMTRPPSTHSNTTPFLPHTTDLHFFTFQVKIPGLTLGHGKMLDKHHLPQKLSSHNLYPEIPNPVVQRGK